MSRLRRMFATAIASRAALPLAAQAQSDEVSPDQPACWLGEMRLSPGAILRFTNADKLCGAE